MLSYDQAAAKKQWREAVRAVTEAIEDAGGVVNNVNDAKLDAVEVWIGESRRGLLDGLRLRTYRCCKSEPSHVCGRYASLPDRKGKGADSQYLIPPHWAVLK